MSHRNSWLRRYLCPDLIHPWKRFLPYYLAIALPRSSVPDLLFVITANVVNKINSLFPFIWNKKQEWMSRASVLQPPDQAGLGVIVVPHRLLFLRAVWLRQFFLALIIIHGPHYFHLTYTLPFQTSQLFKYFLAHAYLTIQLINFHHFILVFRHLGYKR